MIGVGNPRVLIGQGIVTSTVTHSRDIVVSSPRPQAMTTSIVNMAFARLPTLGLSTRLLLSPATGTPTFSLVAVRHLTTSRRTLQAQPAHNHNHDPSKSPRLGTGDYSTRDEPGKYVNPYEGGPSALEKAAHLFFFTEIVRGWFTVATCLVSVVSEFSSLQACG
jgi:hypothetical protein